MVTGLTLRIICTPVLLLNRVRMMSAAGGKRFGHSHAEVLRVKSLLYNLAWFPEDKPTADLGAGI